MTITTDTTLLHDPRRQAALLYWQGFSVPQIAAMLQMKRPTVQSWKQRDGWDSVAPISRVEMSLEARLTQLIIKPQKTGGDFKEIDLLGRQIERLARVNNINTGEEIGTFCNKGGGPEEAAAFGPIFQFFKKGNDLKTLLFAPHEGKLFIWNITQSITQGSTIIDKVIPYTWRNENGGACYNEMYLQNNNILLARVDPFPINDADATLLFYQKRTLDTNKALKNYAIYKQTIKNREAPIIPEDFFASADAFKPDGTKIVQVMGHLPQLNILDFETGQVVGYRMEGGDDFSVFQGKKNIKNYYVEVQADDNYIYALYWGRDRWGMYEIPCVNTIHVFDWYGRLVQKLETDYDIDKMFLDTVRNRLYVTRPKSDDVYYLDLDEVFD